MTARNLRAVWLTASGELFSRGVSLDLPRVPSEPPAPPVDHTFHVDPHGLISSVRADIIASASALSPDGQTVYLQKFGPGLGEWWWVGHEDDDAVCALHQYDSSRRHDPPDPGWWLEDGEWFSFVATTGETQVCHDTLHDVETGRSRPWVYTLRYEVGTLYGQPAWRVWYDPRDQKPAGVRRPGRYECFTFGQPPGETRRRWCRWSEWWTNPDTGIDEITVDHAPRDYALPPPVPVPYVQCPRPSRIPDPTPDPEPEPMPSVNAIPQDVTARSLAELQRFCHSYSFNGEMPYHGDVSSDVDDNRTSFVEGLIFFLMETWMPIMGSPPNPGSLDGWERRRAQADAALQAYMRRRVGDVPQPGAHPSPLVGRLTLGEDGFRDEGALA